MLPRMCRLLHDSFFFFVKIKYFSRGYLFGPLFAVFGALPLMCSILQTGEFNMKSLSKIIMGTLAAVLVMTAPLAAQARPGGCGYGPGPGYWQQSVPEEKRDALYAMMREHQAKVQPLRDELWAKRSLLDALSGNPNADVKEIKALVNEMGAVRAKLRAEQGAFEAQVKKDLGVNAPFDCYGAGGMGYGRHRGFGGPGDHGGYGGYGGYHGGGRW